VREQIRTLFQAGSIGALTDEQSLERYRTPEGLCSETAFAALVERHGPMVLGVCSRLLFDSHLAEDAFQATFLGRPAVLVLESPRGKPPFFLGTTRY
jgi:HlyD family secretion protein